MSQGILDTCVAIDLGRLDPTELPVEQAITTITLGELSVGPFVASSPVERVRRQRHLQAIEERFAESMIGFDVVAAREYGAVMAGASARGPTSRTRVSDFQIAAIALANRLPLYTVNVADFAGIDRLDVRSVTAVPQ